MGGAKVWAWSEGVPKFNTLIWPLFAAASYLLVAAAPPHIQQKFPPVVLKWLPFAVSFLSLGLVGWGMAGMAYGTSLGGAFGLLGWSYPVLVFGLLVKLSNPTDPFARYLVGAGAVTCIWPLIWWLSHGAFQFTGAGIIGIIHNLAFLAVLAVAAGCVAFVIPTEKVPQLRGVDALVPHATAILLLWIPVQVVLLMLAMLIHMSTGFGAIILGARILVSTGAYFGILMLTAPDAYEEAKRMITRSASGQPPSQGGGYPPPQQGGGYPQSGGYPPQGGGYPPQGGGYPPQGGGYPPQGH
jgi:hypothetical protein